jgi:Ca-activated chloride channel family protein
MVLFYTYSFKSKKKALALFAHNEVLSKLLVWVSFPRQYLKAGLLCACVFLIVLTLIEPKWGYKWQEVKRKGIDIIIMLDVSRSMLAQDVKPNRLERAKMEISDLIDNIHGDRVGLLVFAGTSFMQCPLTLDYAAYKLFLNQVDTNSISRGGTNISDAIRRAQASFMEGENRYKAIMLITDGEDLENDPMDAAKEAQKNGIKIFTVGIGSQEGVPIPVFDEQGNKSYVRDKQGNMVLTKLDEQTLQKIALQTGGAYMRATGAGGIGLQKLYDEKISDMEKRDLQSTMQKRYENRYQIPLLCAIILVILEFFVSEKRKARSYEM